MNIKNIKNSITFKIIMFIFIVSSILLGINLSFWLMNQTSTIMFIGGIITIAIVVGLPIEYFIYKSKIKK